MKENFRVPKDLGRKICSGSLIYRLQAPEANLDSAKQNSTFDLSFNFDPEHLLYSLTFKGEVGLCSFSIVTYSIATYSHYLTRKEKLGMRAGVGTSLLISLVMKTWHKVKGCEEDKTPKSEITNRADQKAKATQQYRLLPSSRGHLIHD